jgi:hypothetical protein
LVITDAGKPEAEAALVPWGRWQSQRDPRKRLQSIWSVGVSNSGRRFEVAQYRARWKLPSDQSRDSPTYSAHRSAMAKQLGRGRSRKSAAAQ